MDDDVFKSPQIVMVQPLSGALLGEFIHSQAIAKDGWYISGVELSASRVDAFHILYKKLPEQCCG